MYFLLEAISWCEGDHSTKGKSVLAPSPAGQHSVEIKMRPMESLPPLTHHGDDMAVCSTIFRTFLEPNSIAKDFGP